MEEKYRDVMSQLLYYISDDIDRLLNTDYDHVANAIIGLSRRVNKLSDDIYKDEIVYERPAGKADYKFSIT